MEIATVYLLGDLAVEPIDQIPFRIRVVGVAKQVVLDHVAHRVNQVRTVLNLQVDLKKLEQALEV